MPIRVTMSWILAFVLTMAAGNALACLAEYRSPDEQVAASPLIFVGTVASVEKGIAPDGFGQIPPDEPGPSVATVKIIRVIKGEDPGNQIKVNSGPIWSCAPWAVHYGFAKGQLGVFILADVDKQGVGILRYGGSVLPASKSTVIEQCLQRALSLRRDYLDHVQKTNPAAYAQGQLLADAMRQESKAWPAPPDPVQGAFGLLQLSIATSDEGPMANLVDGLGAIVAKADVESLRVAQAINWCAQSDSPWSAHPAWREAMRRYAVAHRQAVADSVCEYWSARLKQFGVGEKQIKSYIVDPKDDQLADDCAFPVAPPAFRKLGGDNLTTDFIARWCRYDRGAMYREYGMNFDVLGGLDGSRLMEVIPAMYASADEQLSLVAWRAIERIQGMQFVPFIVRQQFSRPDAWSALAFGSWKNQRLEAMLKQVDAEFTPAGAAMFWQSLIRGSCFEPVCVKDAIQRLRKLEEAAATQPATQPSEELDAVHRALVAYLAAAREHWRPTPATLPSSDEFISFFAAHPFRAAD